jgi:hypothetical protein
MKTKREAVEAGRALIRKLKGKGWKLRVWKNIGWQFYAYNGPISVHGKVEYWAVVSNNPDHAGGGWSIWDDPNLKQYSDPNKAVRRAMKFVREYFNRVKAVVERAEAVLS